jgi:hypothetical protein
MAMYFQANSDVQHFLKWEIHDVDISIACTLVFVSGAHVSSCVSILERMFLDLLSKV